METISASRLNGTSAASTATTNATITVFCTGVIVRGLTFANVAGSRPSRPIVNRMRVWPYNVTRVTEKIDITAPAATMVLPAVFPVMWSRITASTASSPLKSCHGWAPNAATATSTWIARDDQQRGDDCPRHGALRVFDLVAGGRYRVKADVGEEDRARGQADARDAERRQVSEAVAH